MTRPDAVALLAGLAPLVSSLAATDPVAGRICAQAGRELARSLATARRGSRGMRVAHGRSVRRFGGAGGVRGRGGRAGLHVQPPVGNGLDGAVLLAEHLAAGRPLTEHTAYLKRP
jgi:hypothetical protein